MLKKTSIVGICLVVGLSIFPEKIVQAGLFDKLKIPKIDIEEVIESQVERATITKRKVSLDGTYYAGNIEKKFHRKNGVVEENTFIIDEPSLVVLHGINNGYNAAMNFIFYDEDSNKVSDKIRIGVNETKDCTIILKPGKYKLKVEFFSLDKNGFCDYKFKLNKTLINQNAPVNINSTNNAYKIELNESITNFFQSIGEWGQDRKSQYYTFYLKTITNVSVNAKKDNIGSCSISLLDADERIIGRKMYFNQDNQIFKEYTLNPGVYYLRIDRESMLGSIYSITLN